jgi:hypothetical protein
MIIKLRAEQAEHIAFTLHDWHHDSLAERFEKPVRDTSMSKQGLFSSKP